MNLRKAIERAVVGSVQPITDAMVRGRIHPNILTTLGFLITVSSAFLFHSHHVRTAGVLILMGGIFDIFDGRVARATGLDSQFGSFYDSTLDRFSEIAVYAGILSLYNDYRADLGDVFMIYATMLAMAGSLMVSYTRARAEALGIDCKVGLMQRGERVIAIGLAAVLFGEANGGLVLGFVIVVLAALTNFTAVQRVVWVYKASRPTGNIEGVASDAAAAEPAPPAELTVGIKEEIT